MRPIVSEGACETDVQNASTDCPVSVRPPVKIVPEIMTGSRTPISAKTFSIAYRHDFMLSVSNDVSGSRMSAPPSISPLICSEYDATIWSNVTGR